MEFGMKPDSVCRQYEREAHSIEEQIREHEFPVGDVGVNNDFGVNDEIGLGQAASDADVHVFSACIYICFLFFFLSDSDDNFFTCLQEEARVAEETASQDSDKDIDEAN
jgi:hypothetical protein